MLVICKMTLGWKKVLMNLVIVSYPSIFQSYQEKFEDYPEICSNMVQYVKTAKHWRNKNVTPFLIVLCCCFWVFELSHVEPDIYIYISWIESIRPELNRLHFNDMSFLSSLVVKTATLFFLIFLIWVQSWF